jgi:hypothetical protein
MATSAPRGSAAIKELAELIDNRIDNRVQEQTRKSSQSFVNRSGRELGTVMGRQSELELKMMALQSTLAAVQKQLTKQYQVLQANGMME